MPKKTVGKKSIRNTVDVYSFAGEKTETKSLPAKFFGQDVKTALLSQAIRLYQSNKHTGNFNTKTRGEVSGGGKKPWAQKETGRARQGSIRAPHWRGGGVIFGPKNKDYTSQMPQKMKQKSLSMALSLKASDKKIKILNAKNAKSSLKTKELNLTLHKIYDLKEKMPKILVITTKENKNIINGLHNLSYVTVFNIGTLNSLSVFNHDELLFSDSAFSFYEK
ncbi:50S ribosomal protein L4 [Candidatus Gottesmanbacteria bacterium]|nr:50S ribosomal protein L4 [Candidatus Gottesmanbacteria bacterium]